MVYKVGSEGVSGNWSVVGLVEDEGIFISDDGEDGVVYGVVFLCIRLCIDFWKGKGEDFKEW